MAVVTIMDTVQRPIEVPWTCKQSGDCCRAVNLITMTWLERVEVERARPEGVKLVWLHHPDPRFTVLQAGPCPLLDGNLCSIWSARPYNCRRFGCFRVDVKVEAFEPEPLRLDLGMYGCKNMSDRVAQSRAVRRNYTLMQRKAQKWGLKHGWSPDMDGCEPLCDRPNKATEHC